MRRLVVGEQVFLWWVGHRHGADGSGCTEILSVRRLGEGGRLVIGFTEGPGRLVPDAVGVVGGAVVNLHQPGVVRALLDAVGACGWGEEELHVDGWTLLAAVQG
ncbi:hypothetical protein [Kitasatospora sp. NBC_01266]|uniref:hypothetical protein n=1 Tax=Kitasatospora sp. NBC_01266 TaxID=2903572 RepID=UPI002E374F4A|nr:hypothetical protein [Kitasatospora sp. NBC_01266]